MSVFFNSLPTNILKCFRGYNILWHLLAIILTYIFVTSGFDWFYFKSSRSTLLQWVLFPAVRLGSRVPIIVPLALYAAGKARKNLTTIRTASALAQSALIGLLIAAFTKHLQEEFIRQDCSNRIPLISAGIFCLGLCAVGYFGAGRLHTPRLPLPWP
jgi:hypothetical protein